MLFFFFFFLQAEDGIRDLVRSRGLGDVYKRQGAISPSSWYSEVGLIVKIAARINRNIVLSDSSLLM